MPMSIDTRQQVANIERLMHQRFLTNTAGKRQPLRRRPHLYHSSLRW
jgi:hypothetical protein